MHVFKITCTQFDWDQVNYNLRACWKKNKPFSDVVNSVKTGRIRQRSTFITVNLYKQGAQKPANAFNSGFKCLNMGGNWGDFQTEPFNTKLIISQKQLRTGGKKKNCVVPWRGGASPRCECTCAPTQGGPGTLHWHTHMHAHIRNIHTLVQIQLSWPVGSGSDMPCGSECLHVIHSVRQLTARFWSRVPHLWSL